MFWIKCLAILAILVNFAHCAPEKVIDLTHTFANGYTISWPSASKYEFKIGNRGFNEEIDSWYVYCIGHTY